MSAGAAPGLPGKQDVFAYLRMALVTGLLEKSAAVAWADQVLINDPNADSDFADLSLAGSQSNAQIVGLLSQLQGPARYDLPLKMLFARAGQLLEADPGQASAIVEGIRLLRAEYHLPAAIRQQMNHLDKNLSLVRQNELAPEALHAQLVEYLQPYSVYRDLLTPPGSSESG